MENENQLKGATLQETKSEIILYQPEETVKLEVRVEDETVWLTQAQIGILFGKSKATISEHISNVFKEGELEQKSVVRDFRTTADDGKTYNVKFYNLDVIISVGYRVKSLQGTRFRRWANQVLKEYLLKGYSINNRIDRLEKTVAEHSQKIDFFVRTALPPVEGIFYAGQIFDAYAFSSNLIKSSKESIVLIDNYIDETVFTLLGKRSQGVTATIYTYSISRQLKLDLEKYNTQYEPIILKDGIR